MTNHRVWIIALGAAIGCKGKAKPSEAQGERAAAEMPAELAAWTQPDAAKLLQGTWAAHLTLRTGGADTMAGDPAVVTIKGETATVWDGKQDHVLPIVFAGPCELGFTDKHANGATYTFPKHYVVRRGTLQLGDGPVGMRKGKAAAVCTSAGVVVVDATGACKTWQNLMHWDSKPETCAWSQKDGKDVLTIGTGDFAPTLTADGELLVTEQWEQEQKQQLWKLSDDATARARVTDELKKHDPGEQAKAAGGKVGDTSTVAGLAATFAADPTAWKGKHVELTAVYLSSNTMTTNGKTSYNVIVVGKPHETTVTLTCNVGAEVTGLTQWDPVTVKGTVRESFGVAELDDCTVVKAH